MNRFLEMKEHGEKIPFSELLKDIPSDDVLAELFPDPMRWGKSLATHKEMLILKLRVEGLTLRQIAEGLNLTPGQVSYLSKNVKNALHNKLPSYVEVDVPALKKILRRG